MFIIIVSVHNLFLPQLCPFFYKITELLNDVEGLKQALSGLSQLTHASGSPSQRPSQRTDTLQRQVRSLQQQLAVSAQARGLRAPLGGFTRVCS